MHIAVNNSIDKKFLPQREAWDEMHGLHVLSQSPDVGFLTADVGRRMPPFVLISSSATFTSTRSPRGLICHMSYDVKVYRGCMSVLKYVNEIYVAGSSNHLGEPIGNLYCLCPDAQPCA